VAGGISQPSLKFLQPLWRRCNSAPDSDGASIF
jgi:hypothetical protein